jgi:hypothetical protein
MLAHALAMRSDSIRERHRRRRGTPKNKTSSRFFAQLPNGEGTELVPPPQTIGAGLPSHQDTLSSNETNGTTASAAVNVNHATANRRRRFPSSVYRSAWNIRSRRNRHQLGTSRCRSCHAQESRANITITAAAKTARVGPAIARTFPPYKPRPSDLTRKAARHRNDAAIRYSTPASRAKRRRCLQAEGQWSERDRCALGSRCLR